MPAPPPITNHRYLRVEDLRQLRHVGFAATRPVEGHYVGRHRSRQRGHSVEFNDYREYTPGDDLRALDWKVLGRTDRPYIRLFEHESDMTVTLVVDASASMAYSGTTRGRGQVAESAASWLDRVPLAQRRRRSAAPLRKYDQACHLAAAIAFLTIRQGDRTAFVASRHRGPRPCEPGSGPLHLHRILTAMESIDPSRTADLAGTLDGLLQSAPRRGLLVVISDLFEDRDAILKRLAIFRGRGGEVIVFHVLHPDELQLPDLDEAVFMDSETGGRVALNVRDVREAYHARLRGFLDGWSLACRRGGHDYNLVSTATPYARALERYLHARSAMR